MKPLYLLCLLALPVFAQPYAQCTLQSCDKTTVRKSISRALAGDAGMAVTLQLDGGVGLSPQILGNDGDAGAPYYSFANDPTIGLFRYGSRQLGVTFGNNASAYGMIISNPFTGVGYRIQGSSGFLDDNSTAGFGLTSTTGSTAITLGTTGTTTITGTTAVVVTGATDTSIKTDRGIVFNTAGTVQPTCAAGVRGLVWYTLSAAGTADRMEICAKASTNVYAWRAMATIP